MDTAVDKSYSRIHRTDRYTLMWSGPYPGHKTVQGRSATGKSTNMSSPVIHGPKWASFAALCFVELGLKRQFAFKSATRTAAMSAVSSTCPQGVIYLYFLFKVRADKSAVCVQEI